VSHAKKKVLKENRFRSATREKRLSESELGAEQVCNAATTGNLSDFLNEGPAPEPKIKKQGGLVAWGKNEKKRITGKQKKKKKLTPERDQK